MPIDKTAYHDLERRFRDQVQKDRGHIIEEVVKGWGVYLPTEELENQADYIFVAMEPSFGGADSIEDAEKKIADGGARAFGSPADYRDKPTKKNLFLFRLSIERFLCKQGETYHLTDLSKGAMPVTVAALDRDRRYEAWYPLLLEEIRIVGKPSAPVIAIGREVEKFLQKKGLKGETNRSLYTVPHYSLLASATHKREAQKDPKGFAAFKKKEFNDDSCWAADLSLAKQQLVFAYKKRFEDIHNQQPRGL